MTPADELNNPPFDPTPVEPQFFIHARASMQAAYPETGETLKEAAFAPERPCLKGFKGSWRELFGPSKAELRGEVHIKGVEILSLLGQKVELLRERNSLYRKNSSLEKQVAIWEKTYTTVSELAQQRIKDIATLRHSLNSANEEIERLAMQPVKPKPKGKRK